MSSFLIVAHAPRLDTCNFAQDRFAEGLHLPHIRYISLHTTNDLKINAGKALAQYLFHTTARA